MKWLAVNPLPAPWQSRREPQESYDVIDRDFRELKRIELAQHELGVRSMVEAAAGCVGQGHPRLDRSQIRWVPAQMLVDRAL